MLEGTGVGGGLRFVERACEQVSQLHTQRSSTVSSLARHCFALLVCPPQIYFVPPLTPRGTKHQVFPNIYLHASTGFTRATLRTCNLPFWRGTSVSKHSKLLKFLHYTRRAQAVHIWTWILPPPRWVLPAPPPSQHPQQAPLTSNGHLLERLIDRRGFVLIIVRLESRGVSRGETGSVLWSVVLYQRGAYCFGTREEEERGCEGAGAARRASCLVRSVGV